MTNYRPSPTDACDNGCGRLPVRELRVARYIDGTKATLCRDCALHVSWENVEAGEPYVAPVLAGQIGLGL